jgi:hypothetical protein
MSEIPKFVPVKSLTVARMLQSHGKATATALVKLTGRPMKSVLATIKTLHQQSKIHVVSYEFSRRGQLSRVWAWGDGDDAREPVMTGNQKFIPHADVASAWMTNPILDKLIETNVQE